MSLIKLHECNDVIKDGSVYVIFCDFSVCVLLIIPSSWHKKLQRRHRMYVQVVRLGLFPWV